MGIHSAAILGIYWQLSAYESSVFLFADPPRVLPEGIHENDLGHDT